MVGLLILIVSPFTRIVRNLLAGNISILGLLKLILNSGGLSINSSSTFSKVKIKLSSLLSFLYIITFPDYIALKKKKKSSSIEFVKLKVGEYCFNCS